MEEGMHPDGQAANNLIAKSFLLAGILAALLGVIIYGYSQLGRDQAKIPHIVALTDESGHRISVVSTDPPMDIDAIELTMPVAGHFNLDGPANRSSVPIPASVLTPAATHSAPLQPGQTISFCTDLPGASVQVLLVDAATNTVLSAHTFSTLPACG